jgi:hypothetical protein
LVYCVILSNHAKVLSFSLSVSSVTYCYFGLGYLIFYIMVVNFDCQLYWLGVPKRLLKHSSGCVQEGVSRDNCLSVSNWRGATCPEYEQHHPIGWGLGWSKVWRRRRSGSTYRLHSSWVRAPITTVITCGHQTPASSAFQFRFTPVTTQGASRPSVSDWGSIIDPLVLKLPVSWTEKAMGSLALQPADSHCGTIQLPTV